MEYEIDWRPTALRDLKVLYDWVDGWADTATASGYVARIETFAAKLRTFPNRGTPHFHLLPGLRTVTFERHIVVTYVVESGVVRILRLIDTARDFQRAFGSTTR